MKEIKELVLFLLGFLPWLLFLFIGGHSLEDLKIAVLVCLAASVVFGFGDLRRGFILSWGTLIFFALCALLVNVAGVTWIATNMDILANLVLASIIWITLIAGRPFALQYAQKDLPREQWGDPRLVESCRFITVVWGVLMLLAMCLTILRRTGAFHAPAWVYPAMSQCLMLGGAVFTVLYKRRKRRQREMSGASLR